MLKKTLLALTLTGLTVTAFAQQPGIKRTPLQKVEFPTATTPSPLSPRSPQAARPDAIPTRESRPVTCSKAS